MNRTKLHTIALHRVDMDTKFGAQQHAPATFSPACHPKQGMKMGYRDGILLMWCRGCGQFVACVEVAS